MGRDAARPADLRADRRFRVGHDVGADAAIGGGELTLELCGNRRRLRVRLPHADARFEPCDHLIARALSTRLHQRIENASHDIHRQKNDRQDRN